MNNQKQNNACVENGVFKLETEILGGGSRGKRVRFGFALYFIKY